MLLSLILLRGSDNTEHKNNYAGNFTRSEMELLSRNTAIIVPSWFWFFTDFYHLLNSNTSIKLFKSANVSLKRQIFFPRISTKFSSVICFKTIYSLFSDVKILCGIKETQIKLRNSEHFIEMIIFVRIASGYSWFAQCLLGTISELDMF